MEDDGEAASANGVGEPAGGLDRLAGLMRVISADVVREALRDTDRANERCCVLSHEVTTWVLLAMGVLTDLPIRRVYQHARRLRPGDVIPTRSALCQARRHAWASRALRAVFERVVRPLVDDQVAGRDTFGGLRLVGIDGTKPRRAGHAGQRGGVRAARRRPRRRRRSRRCTRRSAWSNSAAAANWPSWSNRAAVQRSGDRLGPPPPREARHAGPGRPRVLQFRLGGKPFRAAAAPTCSGGSAATSR